MSAELSYDISPADVIFGLRPAEPDLEGRPDVLDPLPYVIDPAGRVPLGVTFLLTDFAVGRVLLRHLPSRQRVITSHMHVELVPRSIGIAVPLECVGRVVGRTASSGLGRGTLSDTAGVVGHVTSRFELLDLDDRAAGSVWRDRAVEVGSASGPQDRPVDVDDLLRLRLAESGDGAAELRARVGPSLANPRGGLHGGVGGLLTERCATLALRALAGPSQQLHAVELRVFFARPIAANGQELRCRVTLRRLSRRMAVTATEVLTADGKTALLADAVHLLTL